MPLFTVFGRCWSFSGHFWRVVANFDKSHLGARKSFFNSVKSICFPIIQTLKYDHMMKFDFFWLDPPPTPLSHPMQSKNTYKSRGSTPHVCSSTILPRSFLIFFWKITFFDKKYRFFSKTNPFLRETKVQNTYSDHYIHYAPIFLPLYNFV